MMTDIHGPPAVSFYSMLSGLGDQIAANRQQAARQQALTAATQGGVSYGDAMRGLIAANDIPGAQVFANLQNHDDMLKQQALENARSAENDKFNHSIALRTANRLDETDVDKAGYRAQVAQKYGIDPNSPEGRTFIATGSLPEPKRPVPFETLGGTKFMVSQPGGGYTTLDPSTFSQVAPQGAAPNPTPPQAAQPSPQPTSPAVMPPQGGPAPQVQSPAPAQPTANLDEVDPTTGRRENWLKAQSPDVQAYIKKIADYEVDPRTTSIKGGHREQVMSAVAQYDPTYDQNTFGVRAKAMKDFGTGPQGNSIRSFDVGISHLDTLQKYVHALGSGDVRLINQIRNAWLAETGSPLPTNVQAVAPIVGAEVSKAIIGSNNALADREELRKPLQIANSPEQIDQAAGAYKELMAGQLKGLKKQYEDTTGKKNFDSRIREDTRKVLLGGDGSGSASQPNVTSSGIKWSVQ